MLAEISAPRVSNPIKNTQAYDIRTSPVGTQFGGDLGVSVACKFCKLPGCEIESARSNHRKVLHTFKIELNAKGSPKMTKGVLCGAAPAKEKRK